MKKRVLIVDDEALLRNVVSRELRNHFEVLTADNYEHAMAVVENSESLSAVVSDLDLGLGPDGEQVLSQVQQRYPHLQRVLVTGSYDLTSIERMLSSNVAQHWIAKPWNYGQILRLLRDVLDLGSSASTNEPASA